MTNEQLKAYLETNFPDIIVKQGIQYLEVTVTASLYHNTSKTLREEKELAFDYLICQSGVDYPEHLQVVLHLESTKNKHNLVLKVNTVSRSIATLDTVSDLWPTAEFHEREIFDLFGISFTNHPDLRRLFLDDNWGFPLRKDYKDDIHIVER